MCRSALRAGLVAMLCAVVLAAPAAAQRVALSMQGVDPPAGSVRGLAVWDLGTGRQVAGSARHAAHDPVFTADGRYLLFDAQASFGGPTVLTLLDMVTGGETPLPFAFVPFAAHPRELAVFGTSGGVLARIDLSGLHLWTACGAFAVTALDVSTDGAQLVVLCGDAVHVVDSATGGVSRTIPAPTSASDVRLTQGPDVLVVSPTGLERYDSVTGAVLSARPGITGIGAAGPRTETLAWTCTSTPPPRSSYGCQSSLLDSLTLSDVPGIVDRGTFGDYVDHAAAFDDRRALVTRGTYVDGDARLVDGASGAVLAREHRALTAYTTALASPPAAPALSQASPE